MRLLQFDDTGRLTFTKNLSDDQATRLGYAILSHTWGADEDEVNYADIVSGSGHMKEGYKKLEFCGRQAKKDGLQYFWADICCIDKTNSTELSQSLISMFRWYANAERCYVFLQDVDRNTPDWHQTFRSCRWFTRGWTLQELIAPSVLEFFDQVGSSLGTRASLESQINQITGIPTLALRGLALTEFPIHERLQWQQSRQTGVPEDMAYSLLGLLDISMPALYGEGIINARKRLDHEINKQQKGAKYVDFSLTFNALGETKNFVARHNELKEMRHKLVGDGRRRCVTLDGLGGIGKTQLAIAFAARHKQYFSAVLWINASDEDTIKSGMVKAAKQILREHAESCFASIDMSKDVATTVEAVKTWLSMPMNTRWLVIYDNYDNPKAPYNDSTTAFDIRQYLPESDQGSIIITTRSSEVPLGHCMRITKLATIQDSLDILGFSSGRGDLTCDDGAVQLVKRLDGLPLALATAGAYLKQTNVSFTKYLDYYEGSWLRLEQTSPAVLTYEDRTLFSTWQMSYEQVERKNILAANLLRLWAFLDPQDLWFELLDTKNYERPQWLLNLVQDELEFNAAMRVLCSHGFVEVNMLNKFEVESGGYNIHPCLHRWLQALPDRPDSDDLAVAAVLCVASHVPDTDTSDWATLQRRILNHANRCRTRIRTEMLYREDVLWAHYELGCLYFHQTKLEVAEAIFIHGLRIKEANMGPHDPQTLITALNLGKVYQGQEKLDQAQELYLRVLRGRIEHFGEKDESTVSAMFHLAGLYSDQGMSAQAEQMYERVLQLKTELLGPLDVSSLRVVNNLGAIYERRNELAKAEIMYLRAFEGMEAVYGAQSTSTLVAANNLGNIYRMRNRFIEAEQMFTYALALGEDTYGPEYNTTLSSLNGLGMLYANQGMLDKAETMYLRALVGRENLLGPNHSSTLQTAHGLANVYYERRNLQQADVMYTRALNGLHSSQKENQSNILAIMISIGHLRREQEKIPEAKSLYTEVLNRAEEVFGPTHPLAINAVLSLGESSLDEGDFATAETLLIRALNDSESTLGKEHTLTMYGVAQLGILRFGQARFDDAEQLYRRALVAYNRSRVSVNGAIDILKQLLETRPVRVPDSFSSC